MKKQIIIILLIFLLFASFIGQVSATTTIFLTSDNVMGNDDEVTMLNSIKKYIEEYSNGNIKVIVDSKSPSPGEASRAMESGADVNVDFAAADPGNFLILAKYTVNTGKQTIFVNTGDFDLDTASSLRRAWDDNYSSTIFAGLNSPGKYLNESGITYIQPLKAYPDVAHKGHLTQNNEDVNKYIAKKIVNSIGNSNSKYYDNDLVITHKLAPSKMAKASQELIKSNDKEMNGTYNSYTAPQVLYLTSSYLNGNGLESPKEYGAPSNPEQSSIFAKNSYSIYDYMKMGGIVKEFMDKNGRAPNYIEYDGAKIGYYDLVYNFAKITENHTDNGHMDFAREYHFDRMNESILITIFPYVLAIVVLILLCIGLRKIRRR
ncbi:adhesin [Methanobrevibacter sp.]|uniref:adhesin n=1 Tax=Methanobrevibacter sp. TaxID=66852 RepID=UPI00388E3DF2